MPEIAALLRAGAEALGSTPDETQFEQLLGYIELLEKWNRAYNLTAITAAAQIVSHHLLDSLTVLPLVTGPQVLDVGSGAGLPGLVLAVMRPHWRLTLLDSNGKKTRFCQEARRQLQLDNVDVVQARIEDYAPDTGFDSIVSRAFSDLAAFHAATRGAWSGATRLVAMKGQVPDGEISALNLSPDCVEIVNLSIPDVDEQRCAVRIDTACGERELENGETWADESQ